MESLDNINNFKMTDESHNGIVESSELENSLPQHPDGPDNHGGDDEFDSR